MSEIKIGDIVIQDATITRFIDMSSGLPLSMIRVSGKGKPFKELNRAYQEKTFLEFECDILKNPQVLVHGISIDLVENTYSYTLLERAADVSCGYKLIHTYNHPGIDNERSIIVPDEIEVLRGSSYEDTLKRVGKLRELPYIRYILKSDIPEDWI